MTSLGGRTPRKNSGTVSRAADCKPVRMSGQFGNFSFLAAANSWKAFLNSGMLLSFST